MPPYRPRRRGERREQEYVEVHPDGPPVVRVEAVRQSGGEHHDPAGQDQAAGRRDEQGEPPLTTQRRVEPVRIGSGRGGRLVELSDKPGQLAAFGLAHPAQFGLIYHFLIVRRPAARSLNVARGPGPPSAWPGVSWGK